MSAAICESALVPGHWLDRYELLCPIAQGGMAAVWLARMQGKHGFEKVVALKTILPTHAEVPQFRRMFLDEAAIASRIEHGHVAQILDLGELDGTLYLVMEWVEGDSVAHLDRALQAAEQRMPLGAALRIAIDACAGLHAAHELRDDSGQLLGVVHRDVSPQNILVSARGVVKLIDFGIAKARHRSSEETTTGTLKGKVHYMAPEQALGRPIDRRADVWSVGALLYRLLAGHPAHDGENQLETLHRLTTNQPLRPLPDEVPDGVARVVQQALSFDPEYRFDDCAELGRALESAMATEGISYGARELGDLTRHWLGARLESRRQLLESALRGEARVDSPAEPVARRSWPVLAHESSLMSSSTSFDAPPPRRVSRVARTALALVASVAAVALAFVAGRSTPSSASAGAVPVTVVEPARGAAPPPPVAPTAEPSAPLPSPVATPSPPARTALKHAATFSPSSRSKPQRKAINDGF